MASGSDAATASPSATECTELTTTPAPLSAKDRAVAAPIPLLDPVTMTTWEVIGPAGAHRGTIPQLADHPWPGSRLRRSLPVRSALGGHVIGSMATARRRRCRSPRVSPV